MKEGQAAPATTDPLPGTAIGLIQLCGAACVAAGGVGLAVAVFQIAFHQFVEATMARAFIQLVLIPAGGYLYSADMPSNPNWTLMFFTRFLVSFALVCAGCVGLVIDSFEMTMHYMPIQLWQRMVFYAAVLGAGLVVAPMDFKMKMN